MTYADEVQKVSPKNVISDTEMSMKEYKVKRGMQDEGKVGVKCKEQNEVNCKEQNTIK